MEPDDVGIACIVPAFNEEPRIGPVLESIVGSGLFQQVMVVDDGSTDATGRRALDYPITLVTHERNRGKGAALQTGLGRLDPFDIVFFLDADLVNLGKEHMLTLLEPLLETTSLQMTIGVFREGGNIFVDLAQHYFPILNGQRALRHSFTDSLPDLSPSRFGIEVLITKFAEKTEAPFQFIDLEGITHVPKEKKFGPVWGVYARLKMFKEAIEWGIRTKYMFR